MIELDGIEYVVKTPAENTQDLVDYINQYCVDTDVRNSQGEVIEIEVNFTSPIYLLLWAVGYMATVIQKLLYSIGRQYSIAASSEKQLLNIASNAGLKRRDPTYTTIRVMAFASDDGTCEITTALKVTIPIEGKNYQFNPTYAVSIAAGQHAVLVLTANVLGSLSLLAGAIVAFDTDVPYLDHLVSEASVPGRDIESIPALRRRLQDRQNLNSGLDRAIQAIRNLAGVVACNIFYNSNSLESVVINGVTIPPRCTTIYVQGYSPNIGKAYFAHIDRASVNTDGAITQTVALLNGQTVNAYILPPVLRPVYIRVYTLEELPDSMQLALKNLIINISIDLDIGDRLTVAQVLEKMTTEYKVLGALTSFASDSGFTYQVVPNANELIYIDKANISVLVQGT